MLGHDLPDELDKFLAAREDELIAFRRDLHAHPELGYHEHRTTSRVSLRLAAAGLRPVILPKGTGLIVDVGDEAAALHVDAAHLGHVSCNGFWNLLLERLELYLHVRRAISEAKL